MSNRVIHFEIPADNPQETINFFKATFNWSFEQLGKDEYWIAKTGSDQNQGINGAIMKRRHPQQPVANSISVENMDQTLKLIKENGGIIVVDKMPIPGIGWIAFFKDPDNNIHGLWQADKTDE